MTQRKLDIPKNVRYLRLLLLLLIILAINTGGAWLVHQVDFQIFPRHEPVLHILVLSFIAFYILLMTLPFMPGIEVGVALMLLLGSKGAVLVYLSTLLALSISFAIGRVVSCQVICSVLNWLHFHKSCALIEQIEPMDPQQRLTFMYQRAPRKIVPFFLKHRYLAIAALLNLPGNALIGGGGGIGLIIGMSKIIPFHRYLFLLAVAISPIPLIFYLQGL